MKVADEVKLLREQMTEGARILNELSKQQTQLAKVVKSLNDSLFEAERKLEALEMDFKARECR